MGEDNWYHSTDMSISLADNYSKLYFQFILIVAPYIKQNELLEYRVPRNHFALTAFVSPPKNN